VHLALHIGNAFGAGWMGRQPLGWSTFGGGTHLLPKRDARSRIARSKPWLLKSMGFQHSFRYESARDREATDYDAFVRVSCEAISNESQRERRPNDTTNDAA
jgi:hypothetical protein